MVLKVQNVKSKRWYVKGVNRGRNKTNHGSDPHGDRFGGNHVVDRSVPDY